jgi:hypothetical protein
LTVVRLLDTLAFSSVWVAAAAAALVAAASRALEIPFDPRLAGLAAAGTLVVYNVDRLRDLERDRLTAPVRSAFVERWRSALLGLAAAAAAAAVALTWLCGPRVFLVLLPTAAAGLLHRRLKHLVWAKGGYIALAWTAVAVGLPAVTAAAPRNTLQVSVIVLLAVYANAIASNIRDAEAGAARIGLQRALHISRLVAGASLLVAAVGPTPVRPLLAVPLLTLGALVFFRADERYGLVVVDGALLVGALIATLSP